MFEKVESLRKKLNNMLESDDVILHSDEILKVSKKLDKLIVEAQKLHLKNI
jgi:hypothetical protein